MDFDKFVEKDMLEFLDQQAMLIAEKAAGLREEEFDLYEITKDYSKEITEALKDEDLAKAKKIFEDVKNKYIKAPPNSMSKKRLYTIMEEIYERIKDFEAKEEGKKNLFDTIKDYEEKGLFKMPEMFQGKEMDTLSLLLSTIAYKEKELERISVKKPITDADAERAIKLYRDLKELVKRIPDSAQKEKSKVYDATLSWYYTIKKMKEKMITEEQTKVQKAIDQEKKLADEKNINELLEEVRKLKEEIIKSHFRISEYVKKKELKKSIEEYKRLKDLCEQFPHEMEEEKTALLADALSLYESIRKLKQSLVQEGKLSEAENEEEKLDTKNREEISKEIHERLGRIKAMLANKNTQGAIQEYKNLNEIFQTYPDEPIEEKKHLYDSIVSAHKDIKIIDADFQRKNATDNENTNRIKKDLDETNAMLDKGMIEEASHKLLEAKHKIQLLPAEDFDDKYLLLKEVEKLEHKLLFVQNVQKINAPKIVQQ